MEHCVITMTLALQVKLIFTSEFYSFFFFMVSWNLCTPDLLNAVLA